MLRVTAPLDRSNPIVVLITAPSAAEARTLADRLVEENLAACVQILAPMESVYRWKGQVESAAEVLLLVKTLETHFKELETRVRAVHSYETPEIVAIPVTAISSPYLEWLVESLASQPD